MPVSTPLTPESIDFEIEESADRHSDLRTDKEAKTLAETHHFFHTSRPSEVRKATAPDPDETSTNASGKDADVAKNDANDDSDDDDGSSSSSSNIFTTGASHHAAASASTSYVSSTTFPTVTPTTPSMSLSHPTTSRHPSLTTGQGQRRGADMRETSVQRTRSPRVQAVLRQGGPQSRGRHSISPMAPDARRAPPVELQGPPRYLRECGLSPSPSAVAAARRRSAHHDHHHHEYRRASHSRHNASPPTSRSSPSPSTPSGQRRRKHRDKAEADNAKVEAVVRSASKTSKKKKQPNNDGEEEERHRSSPRHSRGAASVEKTVEKRKRRTKETHADTRTSLTPREGPRNGAGLSNSSRTAKEEKVRKWMPVMAPALAAAADVDDEDAQLLYPPALTVHQLQQQQQQQQQSMQWSSRNELSSVSFHSRSLYGGGGGDGVGRVGEASVADIHAPPPRATSPGGRSLHNAQGQTARQDHTRMDNLGRNATDAGAKQTIMRTDLRGDGAEVDLSVPVLSAHGNRRRDGRDEPADAGPSGPAAWTSAHPNSQPGSAHHRYDATSTRDSELRSERFRVDQRRTAGGGVGTFSSPPAEALSQPGHRFGLPASKTEGPFTGRGIGLPNSSNAGGGAAGVSPSPRFSASPQLASPSAIPHSYVAHSFSSYLPGNSTLLNAGGGGGPFAKTGRNGSSALPLQSRALAAKGDAVGLDVAVMAQAVAELPPPNVLEQYETLLSDYFTHQRRKEGDVAALFSLVVHIRLPPATTTATADAQQERGGKNATTSLQHAEEEEEQQQQQQPSSRAVVTVGDVKDEVALRTGIPAAQQCIVFEAMSLQDSLPVHLLLSAAATTTTTPAPGTAAADASSSGSSSSSNSTVGLRLLCVPLIVDAAQDKLSPTRRRHNMMLTDNDRSALRGATLDNGGRLDGMRGSARNVGEDDLRELLLMSPPSYSATSATQQQQQQQQGEAGDARAAESNPPSRRGAVPFTLSQSTLNAQRVLQARAEAPEAVAAHIRRLRQLYLNDGAGQSGQNGETTLEDGRNLTSGEYLLSREYHINDAGRVEYADPAVHALQQQLLLSQLTAPARPVNPPPVTTAPLSTLRNGNSRALSDALIGALPAPPTRQQQQQQQQQQRLRPSAAFNGGGAQSADGVVSATQTSALHAQTVPKGSGSGGSVMSCSAIAQSRFGIAPLPPQSSPAISVLRHTHQKSEAPRNTQPQRRRHSFLGEEGEGDSETEGGGGVGASWLESSTTSMYSAAGGGVADLDDGDDATSRTQSTYDY